MTIKPIGDSEWIIAIKDTPYNVAHNQDNVYVVYASREAVIDAAKHVSELRKVRYHMGEPFFGTTILMKAG